MSSPPTMGIGTSSSSSGASAPRANAYAVNRDASELRRSPARKAPASAQPGPMHVIYTSVDTGFRGPSGPRTVGEPATDGHGPAHGRPRTSPRTGAEKATDGAGGSGYADRSRPDSRSDLPFQDACSMSPSPSS